MSELFPLPGDISLTSNVVNAIRDGYRHVPGVPNPLASIEFGIPVDRAKPSHWVISFFSKDYASAETIWRIEDIELALSQDAQNRLRHKIVDIAKGEIVVYNKPLQS